MAREQMRQAWTRPPIAQGPVEDPSQSIFESAITDPQKAAAGFRDYVSRAASDMTQRALAEERQRTAAMMEQQRAAMAIENALSQHRNLTDTPEKMREFIGEVAKVKAMHDAAGMGRLPESVYLNKAAEALRARVSRPAGQAPAAAPAFVEGGSAGSLAGNPAIPQNKPLEKNPLEKKYGMPAGTIRDMPDPDEMLVELKSFIDSENADREKHQVMPSYTEVMVRE